MQNLLTSKSYWAGFITSSLIGFICLLAFLVYSCNESLKYGKMGSGAHKDSPNSSYEAQASNILDYTTSKEALTYYEFSVIEKASGEVLVNKKLYSESESDMVQFRQGRGKIMWSEDSTTVSFGDGSRNLWSFSIKD